MQAKVRITITATDELKMVAQTRIMEITLGKPTMIAVVLEMQLKPKERGGQGKEGGNCSS